MQNSITEYLKEAQIRGFIGQDEIEKSLEISKLFLPLISKNSKRIIDLGCGIGIPGLYIYENSDLSVDFLDSNLRRTSFLKAYLISNKKPTEIFCEEYKDAEKFLEYNTIVSRGFFSHNRLVKEFKEAGFEGEIITTGLENDKYYENTEVYTYPQVTILKTKCFTWNIKIFFYKYPPEIYIILIVFISCQQKYIQ